MCLYTPPNRVPTIGDTIMGMNRDISKKFIVTDIKELKYISIIPEEQFLNGYLTEYTYRWPTLASDVTRWELTLEDTEVEAKKSCSVS
jgi:hypothetical protein